MITKREKITNSIIKELNEKYPNMEDSITSDVSYKIKLEYITFEIDFITDPLITYLIEEYGSTVIGLIHFFRTKMCLLGWCVRVDNFYLNQLLKECANLLNSDKDTLLKIYNELIEYEFFYEVSDPNVVKGTYLTCIQQVFNYEMTASQRKKDREKKAKQRAKAKNKIDEDNNINQNNVINNQEQQFNDNFQNGQSLEDFMGDYQKFFDNQEDYENNTF